MATIKVILEKGEQEHEAEEKLYKALELHRNGNLHKEDYHDPAMVDLTNKINDLHKKELTSLLEEISELLDSEYQG